MDGLDEFLNGCERKAGLSELRAMLLRITAVPGDAPLVLSSHERLTSRVYRLSFVPRTGGANRSVIVKSLRPDDARRSQLVAERWLPTVDLEHLRPALLGVAAEQEGRCVWHAYKDLPGKPLNESGSDRDGVIAAIESIAALHMGFDDHPLLAECRVRGGVRDGHFYSSQVRDAQRILESLRPPRVKPSEEDESLRQRMLKWLRRLLEEEQDRLNILEEFAGRETLLHADLWPKNVIVEPKGDGQSHARLIDWDRAAVGPVSYDLSTFVSRFPVGDRPWILERYRRAVAPHGWQLPPDSTLGVLLETAEWARLANSVIWAALSVWESRARWAWEELALVEQWFQAARPILPAPVEAHL